MRIIIFGSTGGVGRHIVTRALDQGHTVTAFARTPTKLDLKHENLRIVSGDVTDQAAVEQAVQGHDAVLAAIGSPSLTNRTLRSEANRLIIGAMKKAGVWRLISLSTMGAGDSWAMLSLKYKLIFSTLLHAPLADHNAQEEAIKQSNLDWTIVRPGGFTDGPLTGRYRHGFPVTDKSIKGRISRADVAHFMLAQLHDSTNVRQTPGLSY